MGMSSEPDYNMFCSAITLEFCQKPRPRNRVIWFGVINYFLGKTGPDDYNGFFPTFSAPPSVQRFPCKADHVWTLRERPISRGPRAVYDFLLDQIPCFSGVCTEIFRGTCKRRHTGTRYNATTFKCGFAPGAVCVRQRGAPAPL